MSIIAPPPKKKQNKKRPRQTNFENYRLQQSIIKSKLCTFFSPPELSYLLVKQFNISPITAFLHVTCQNMKMFKIDQINVLKSTLTSEVTMT